MNSEISLAFVGSVRKDAFAGILGEKCSPFAAFRKHLHSECREQNPSHVFKEVKRNPKQNGIKVYHKSLPLPLLRLFVEKNEKEIYFFVFVFQNNFVSVRKRCSHVVLLRSRSIIQKGETIKMRFSVFGFIQMTVHERALEAGS